MYRLNSVLRRYCIKVKEITLVRINKDSWRIFYCMALLLLSISKITWNNHFSCIQQNLLRIKVVSQVISIATLQ